MLSLFRPISAGMTFFAMWDLQNVWMEKKIFLFLPVFSLFALISSHILIGGMIYF